MGAGECGRKTKAKDDSGVFDPSKEGCSCPPAEPGSWGEPGCGDADFVGVFCLFLAALGLRCCVRAFSSCSEWGLLFVAVRGLLIAVASLVVDHRL